MGMNFPQTEVDVLRFWRENDAFQTQLHLTKDGDNFTFYDGPPFATGLPHYGHLLTSTIKDIIPRYMSMKGRFVTRRFGWDTHGLPIEFEIDKKFGISGRAAVMEMGIGNYNAECRKIVMRYATQWRETIERLGRWIDFDNDYKSMDTTFMESCWWVFKQLHEQGQVYRDYQIMPFSTALGTPLSQMEAKQNEKTTQDPAVLVAFPVKGLNVSLIIYTTTPWTLPSNLLIAVKPELEYIEILDEASGKQYVLHETGLSMLYGKNLKKAKFRIMQKRRGKDMVGWEYEPLFRYFAEAYADCFRVIGADYVEEGEGTGLVHQAPAFGQEDYDAAKAAGFFGEGRLPPCPVDSNGCFTEEVPDFVGQHVKSADKEVLKALRPTGRLLSESQVSHVDKFCWRSDTQLIRRASSSWFIRVTSSIPAILVNLEATTWVPSFVGTNRFKAWIANAHDWNVSRNRYWGTPIPLWVSDDYEEVVCVGSIDELRELSDHQGALDDIHRDKVDDITIPSKQGKGVLRRVDEVFDCWFESGSMPYASNHYPFKDSSSFLGKQFPADFIAEGLDQTRGWFYTLTVLGNKLFKTSPFKNCIVNGLVLAEDGKKMSKSLKNYPDPSLVIEKYGADALRLYLINSPVVRGEPLRFKESGVKEVVSKVLLPLWNSFSFFSQQATLYKKNTGADFVAHTPFADVELPNMMDRWVLADCHGMLAFVEEEMKNYRLYTVVPRLLRVLDNLTNWYIRFNRKRLKGVSGLGQSDMEAALNTLLQVLFTLTRALAPFIPFLTEHLYQLLKPYLGMELAPFENSSSVHYLSFPTVQDAFFDQVIERRVSWMQEVIQLGRVARERVGISLKTPLMKLVIITSAQIILDLEALQSYVKEELNVSEIMLTDNDEQYNIMLEARVDWPTLGKKLKSQVQTVRKALPNLTQEQLKQYVKDKGMTIEGIKLEEDDLNIVRVLAKGEQASQFEPAFSNNVIILLDTSSTSELQAEGLARDIVNRVQRIRKKAGLVPTDDIHVEYKILANPAGVDLEAALSSQQSLVQNALRGTLEPIGNDPPVDKLILEEDQQIDQLAFKLRLVRV